MDVNFYSLFEKPETSIAYEYLRAYENVWDALSDIPEIILKIGETLDPEEYEKLDTGIWVSRKATIFPSAYIGGPAIIMAGAEVRHSAFIRSSALVGRGAVVGNSTELKNCILFDGVQVPHFNYIGDSILGYKSHMGAGAVTSNVKSDKTNICIKSGDGDVIDTGRRKFGAIIGDHVEVGCGSVLNPGTVIGKETNIYPLSSVRGYIPSRSIYKTGGIIVEKSN